MRVSAILAILLTCTAGFSQSVYNNGSVISISGSTIFSVGESLTNNGQVINNGDLIITGTWINNGNYDEGSGQITLNSPGTQIVNHNDQSFNILNITGGGQKLFQADITVVGTLNLVDGVLVSENGARIIMEDGSVLSGGSASSYIQGPFYHRGTGSRLFPIGTANDYLPVELMDVTGTGPEIGFTITEPNPDPVSGEGLQSVSTLRYWSMDITSGTFAGSPISLAVVNETVSNDIARLVVAEANQVGGPFASLGQFESTGTTQSGSVVSDQPASGTIFAVGAIPGSGEELEVTIFNVLSPNNDGRHDFFKILNISSFPDNTVTIFNRWGDKVFETSGYDNDTNIFDGTSDQGNELPDGTYYYVINKGDGSDKLNGYLVLRR